MAGHGIARVSDEISARCANPQRQPAADPVVLFMHHWQQARAMANSRVPACFGFIPSFIRSAKRATIELRFDMIEIKYTGDELWTRIERAVEKVKERLRRVTNALNAAGVPYAVIGGNAVQHWVAQVDESVVRNTRDVDIILNESDLDRAIVALEEVGFIYPRAAGVSMFLDGPAAKARDAVHVVFAGKKVREEYPEPVPNIDDYELIEDAKTLPFEALVKMKLTSFRRKDQVHILDMISVGLIDKSWLARLSPELRRRLQELLDDPDG